METSDLRKLAIDSNQKTWGLLATEKRSELQNHEMLEAAFASLHLWKLAGGTSLNLARGHWLISRVACVLEEPGIAWEQARLCDRYTRESTDRLDFDEAYRLEALARAHALRGEHDLALDFHTQATHAGNALQDEEDRRIFVGDLAAEPWFGLKF